MQNFLSYHFVLMARLLRRPTCCHERYFRGSIAFLLRLSPAEERSNAGDKFQTLKALEQAPPKLKRPPCPLWMSPAYIQLIDKRAPLCWNPHHIQNVASGIMRAVRRSLMMDSHRRAEDAATEIGTCLQPTTEGANPRRAYAILKRWYRHGRPTPPERTSKSWGGISRPPARGRSHKPLVCPWIHTSTQQR